jgi:hypothetical protein
MKEAVGQRVTEVAWCEVRPCGADGVKAREATAEGRRLGVK